MAALPSYVGVLFDGYSESFDPAIERTEMERGEPKQAVINSQVLMKLGVSLRFNSKADVASFETWYFDTIGRIGTFTMTHPRTGATITARFENGSIGTLVPLDLDFAIAQRDVVIEYLR
jgi:hypothetical protein